MCLAPDGQTWICVISHGPDGVVGNLFDGPPEVVLDRAIAFPPAADLGRDGSPVRHCDHLPQAGGARCSAATWRRRPPDGPRRGRRNDNE